MQLTQPNKHVSVQIRALEALCNFVLEFSPTRTVVLASKPLLAFMIQTATSACSSPATTGDPSSFNAALCLNAVWCLRNLLFKASVEVKRLLLTELTTPTLLALASHTNVSIRAQALAILQNLFFCDINAIAELCDVSQVLMLVRKQLLGESDLEVLERALYALCNICAGDANIKSLVIEHELLLAISPFFVRTRVESAIFWLRLIDRVGANSQRHSQPAIRLAAVWCIANLLRDDHLLNERIQRLRSLSIDEHMNSMRVDSNIEVRERAARCCIVFNHAPSPASD